MQVTQIATLINNTITETTGSSTLLTEDLQNVIDVGNSLFSNTSVDNFVKKLVNRIGKTIFVDRKYRGSAPNVIMDSWEYGSVLQKITADLPISVENDTWKLVNGQSYDPNIFYQPTVENKFFNNRVTFEINLSFTEKQVKESFTSPEQLNGFLSMLYNSVETALTARNDNLIMRTINNMIGETLYTLYDGTKIDLTTGNAKCINLLAEYNKSVNTPLILGRALTFGVEPFVKFCISYINRYVDRLKTLSTLFNVAGKERFTPIEDLRIVMHTDLARSLAEIGLATTVSPRFIDIHNPIDKIPFWQGSGTSYNVSDTSAINIITSGNHSVSVSGIVGVMFDRNALGVANLDRRVTTNYNPKAEFFTNFYKFDAGYFNDFNENFVVFYIA